MLQGVFHLLGLGRRRRLVELPVAADLGALLLTASFFLQDVAGDSERESGDIAYTFFDVCFSGAFAEPVDGLVCERHGIFGAVPLEEAGKPFVELAILLCGLLLVRVEQVEDFFEHLFMHGFTFV
jgi:hypothetical protein